MEIPTYQPKISILLTKVVSRRGAKRGNKEVQTPLQLADWLGESGGVTVHRSLSGSDGSFTITLADRMDKATQDSLYARIEPQDHVTIRMSGTPHQYPEGRMPAVLRGFATSVKRSEVMGSDGKPVRAVVITGHDYYKLLFHNQIFYRRQYKLGKDLLTQFPMFEASGIEFDTMKAAQFVKTVVEKVLNPWLDEMWLASALEEPFRLNVDATVQDGRIAPHSMTFFQGSLWTLITEWADLGWNELFFRDDEAGQHLVYRPIPWRTLEGKFASQDPGVQDPEEVEILDRDVVKLEVSRSDMDVANYCAVQAPRALMVNREMLETDFLQNGVYFPGDGEDLNSAIALFGLKKLEHVSAQCEDRVTHHPDNASPEEKKALGGYMGEWIGRRVQELWDLNRDNLVYETGHLTIRGNEAVEPGKSLRIKRGNTEMTCYVRSVTHNFQPFKSFTTDVEVNRGTGFIERYSRAGSPYFAEMARPR